MVEYTLHLDSVFSSLADSTRRDILRRVASRELSVSEIAEPYEVSMAAVSKHLKILEGANLIIKKRQGKQQIVQVSPAAFKDAAEYLSHYEKLRNEQFDSLEQYLKEKEGENE